MKIIDSVKSVFDKKSSCCDSFISDCSFTEGDPSASFTKLKVHKDNTEIGVVGNDFYKGIGNITCDRSTFLKDKDCDGAFFIEGEDRNVIILLDMKSSFCSDTVYDAYRQDFFSFLKIHMMLSLCAGYNVNKLDINCYVACPPCATEAEIASIKDSILMDEEIGNERFVDKCLKEYLFGNTYFSCYVKDIPFVNNRDLHEDIMNAPISFHIFCPEKSTDAEGLLIL